MQIPPQIFAAEEDLNYRITMVVTLTSLDFRNDELGTMLHCLLVDDACSLHITSPCCASHSAQCHPRPDG